MRNTWRAEFEENEEIRVVGKAADFDVRRSVVIFTKSGSHNWDEDDEDD